MKKVALVFLLAVFVPSLVLAWLAVRSLRDQQLVLERQQSLLCQGVADALAKEADDFMVSRQEDFGRQVETLLGRPDISDIRVAFDEKLRKSWPPAEVGFVVTTGGTLSCPLPSSGPVAKDFFTENGKFLCNIQTAQVYLNNSKGVYNNSLNGANNNEQQLANTQAPFQEKVERNVMPQQQIEQSAGQNSAPQYSKLAPAEGEFRQLVGDSTEGTVARFLDNKLRVLIWYRSHADSGLIFGSQLSVPKIIEGLQPIVGHVDSSLKSEIAVALLDDKARPVAVSVPGFRTAWKHPFVATELSEALPHWELAVYLRDPNRLTQSAHTLRLTLGVLIGVLIVAITVGGWLIVSDLNRQLALARQKTDFVSNVSHELKTPLTSIRMFSELLAEGRVTDAEKRQSYLNIITAETSRLTRLINNVLDFSRMERGEKKYNFQPCDMASLARETLDAYRPQLEANGFKVSAVWPDSPVAIQGDRDALAQVMVNLLSNAEKYSDKQKEITVQVETITEPLPHVDVRISDCGIGVPRGCGGKIFEQFYRAHDSLSSGIQGSGLGLTLARQIARAHGGDVIYQPRDGGGSCFTLRLPLANPTLAA